MWKNSLPFCWLIFLLSPLSAVSLEIVRFPATVDRVQLWELDFLAPDYPPFPLHNGITAAIQQPDGEVLLVPAFWTQDYKLTYEAAKRSDAAAWQSREYQREIPEPDPERAAHWRIRFTPTQAGSHPVILLAPDGESQLWKGVFQVREAAGRGFLRRGPEGENYLHFDSGEGFFALGFNVCWPPSEEGVRGYLRYLDRLAENGCNYTRLWLCTWGFRLETVEPARIDLAAAWQVEEILHAAAARGIYIKLCIDNFHDFTMNQERSPYFGKKGPCASPDQFFTSAAARIIYEARLRYLIGRFSAFTSLYAWELWNEVDLALPDNSRISARNRKEMILSWTKEIAAHLKKSDPHRHLVTTSLSSHQLWPELWDLSELDIVQYHAYLSSQPLARIFDEGNEPRFFRQQVDRLRIWKKPVLMAEYGYMGTNEYNPLNALDREGIALHNGLWSAALSGYSGTPMLWWWDTYLEPNNLYFHYRALSRFLEGVDWRLPKTFLSSEDDPQARVLLMMDSGGLSAWLQNREAGWSSRLEAGIDPGVIKGLLLTVNGLPSGPCRFSWVDPWSGEAISGAEARVESGRLVLEAPPFDRDIGLRVFLPRDGE